MLSCSVASTSTYLTISCSRRSLRPSYSRLHRIQSSRRRRELDRRTRRVPLIPTGNLRSVTSTSLPSHSVNLIRPRKQRTLLSISTILCGLIRPGRTLTERFLTSKRKDEARTRTSAYQYLDSRDGQVCLNERWKDGEGGNEIRIEAGP
jgi:hypothetical protein